MVAWQTCPWEMRDTWPFLALALLLDVGSLPALVIALWIAIRAMPRWVRTALGNRHARGHLADCAAAWVAGWSWTDRVIRGIIGWFLVTLALAALVGGDRSGVLVTSLIVTLAYWTAYVVLLVAVRKRGPTGAGRRW